MLNRISIENLSGFAVYYGIFAFIIVMIVMKLVKWINNKALLLVVGFVLVCIAAFRAPGIDRDYDNYITSFQDFGHPFDYFTQYNNFFFYEPFYYLIPSFCKLIFSGDLYIHVVFLIAAIAGISLNLNAIEKLSSFPGLSVLHYFCFFYLLHSMTQIRADIACGLMMLCVYYHYNKNYLSFFLFFLLALMVHYTAILIPLILLINPKKFSLKINLLILAVVVSLAVLQLDMFLPILLQFNVAFVQKLVLELNSTNTNNNAINIFNADFIMRLAVTIWLMIHHKRIYEKNKYGYLLLRLQIFSIFCYCAFTSVAMLAFRLSEFFGIVTIITTPLLVYTFRSKVAGYAAVITYSLLLLILNLHFSELLEPYKSYLFL